MRFHAPLLLVGTGLFVGCAVDQDKEVATYRKVIDTPATQPTTQPAYQDGQPLPLARAMQLANSNNESLASSGETYLQALIDKDRAAAAFFPRISLAPTYFVQDKTADGNDRNDQFDVPAAGSWNVFNGFRDVANTRRAGATIDQRRDELLDLQASLMLDVARVYYEVLRSEQSVRVLESSLAVQEERLRDTTGRQKAGLARPLDVAQSQAQVSATRVQLLAARSDVVNGRSTLAYLINAPVHTVQLPDGFDPAIKVPQLESMVRIALERRHDLAAAQSATRAAKQVVASAFNQYFPTVDLNANYFFSRDSSPTDSNWNVLLSVNLPIFTAGLIHADVRDAWSRYRQAVLFETQLRRQVDRDVRQSLENLTSTLARLDELRVQATAARQALQQADQSYRVGLATNLERLTAQDQVLSAELQLASAEYERKFFYLDLLRQVGRLSVPGDRLASLFEAPTATSR